MSEYPPGVTRDDLYKALTIIRDMRARMLVEKVDPRSVAIAIWAAAYMDLLAASEHIDIQEYKALQTYAKDLAKRGQEAFYR